MRLRIPGWRLSKASAIFGPKSIAFQEPVGFDNKLSVWITEEKQTDVAIAVDLLCDVLDDACDQVVIPSDRAPALHEV